MAIPSRRAGGVHVERPQRSEDERRGHRQAVEDDQQRRKSLPLTDHLHRHLDKLSFSGPFRLSGGVGTGKTVVLVHRARALARRDPNARIVLTTFTTTL